MQQPLANVTLNCGYPMEFYIPLFLAAVDDVTAYPAVGDNLAESRGMRDG